jgi:hypothetical protein
VGQFEIRFAAEVVVHEVQFDGVIVDLNLLRERIGQAAGWPGLERPREDPVFRQVSTIHLK